MRIILKKVIEEGGIKLIEKEMNVLFFNTYKQCTSSEDKKKERNKIKQILPDNSSHLCSKTFGKATKITRSKAGCLQLQ